MRIAIDIDSTLHHYWDVLSETARRRFGVELPYEAQFDWGVTRLRPEQFEVCERETHSDAAILAAKPYPHAVETVNGWRDAGHFIHITSHRRPSCRAATGRWLETIGLGYDDLCCSDDKIERCGQVGIDLLIDDNPDTLARALEHGMAVATISHPWNEEFCEEEDVVEGRDWPELAAKLEPVLAASVGDHHSIPGS